MKTGIKLRWINRKTQQDLVLPFLRRVLFSHCKEARREARALTESRKSCRWSSDSASPWSPEPWLPASPRPARAHPEQAQKGSCARPRLSDNAIKWLLVNQEGSHVAVNPNRAKPSQLSAELCCSCWDCMQPVSTIFAPSPYTELRWDLLDHLEILLNSWPPNEKIHLVSPYIFF